MVSHRRLKDRPTGQSLFKKAISQGIGHDATIGTIHANGLDGHVVICAAVHDLNLHFVADVLRQLKEVGMHPSVISILDHIAIGTIREEGGGLLGKPSVNGAVCVNIQTDVKYGGR